MHDKKYPGLDVNPMREAYEFELLSVETIQKLCIAGYGCFKDVKSTPLSKLHAAAELTEAEIQEVKNMLLRFP